MRALCALLLASLGGCGWQTGLIAPDGVRSIGIEYFNNTTPEPDLEVAFAAVLGESLVTLVALPVRPPDGADLVIRGRIDEFRRRSGVRDEDNQLLESGVRIGVQAELVDRATGITLRTSDARLWGGFAVDRTENELDTRVRVLRNLADEVILDLFAPPTYKESATGVPE